MNITGAVNINRGSAVGTKWVSHHMVNGDSNTQDIFNNTSSKPKPTARHALMRTRESTHPYSHIYHPTYTLLVFLLHSKRLILMRKESLHLQIFNAGDQLRCGKYLWIAHQCWLPCAQTGIRPANHWTLGLNHCCCFNRWTPFCTLCCGRRTSLWSVAYLRVFVRGKWCVTEDQQ